jgi:HEPN domain
MRKSAYFANAINTAAIGKPEVTMKNAELIEARFQELLTGGAQILSTRRPPPANVIGDDRVDFEHSQQWRTSASQFLASLFGKDSEYYLRFQGGFKHAGYYSDMAAGLAVIKAGWNDYSKGYLSELRALIRAEVFDDFLEQAQHLFEQGYYQPAAVLAGGVLEDSLRKLCVRSGIALATKPKLDGMNAELAKKAVYNTLVQKRITWLADIRNKAAHGQVTGFSSSDVDTMLRQVRDFVTDFLS